MFELCRKTFLYCPARQQTRFWGRERKRDFLPRKLDGWQDGRLVGWLAVLGFSLCQDNSIVLAGELRYCIEFLGAAAAAAATTTTSDE